MLGARGAWNEGGTPPTPQPSPPPTFPSADIPIHPQLMDLKLTVDGLEKERDFYFSKLRDIELICQEHENENSPIINGIVSVLYATEVRWPAPLPRGWEPLPGVAAVPVLTVPCPPRRRASPRRRTTSWRSSRRRSRTSTDPPRLTPRPTPP